MAFGVENRENVFDLRLFSTRTENLSSNVRLRVTSRQNDVVSGLVSNRRRERDVKGVAEHSDWSVGGGFIGSKAEEETTVA